MEKDKIIQRGDVAKYQLIITHADFDQQRDPFFVILHFGMSQKTMRIDKEDMHQDEDDNWFVTFPTRGLPLGQVKAETHFMVEDVDACGGRRWEVEFDWIGFVTDDPCPKFSGDSSKFCFCRCSNHVEFIRTFRQDVNSLMARVLYKDGEPVVDQDGRKMFVDIDKTYLYAKMNRWYYDTIRPCFDDISKKFKAVNDELKTLRTMVTSTTNNGVTLSDRFGVAEDIGVNQKTLTEAINAIWKKFEQITGEPAGGIGLTVTPEYFISEDDCTVHISALHSTGMFESVKFYVDDVLITEAKNVKEYHYDTQIDKTSEIKCVASILGIEYMDKKIVTKYFPFFIGSGQKWDDIVRHSNARPFDGSVKGEYDVRVENEGDHIFIIIPASLKDQMVRADMNGFEIPFEVTNSEKYIIYSSVNTYRKGVYGIDLTANCECACG